MSSTLWPAVEEEKKMRFFKQVGTVTRMGLATIPDRLGDSLVVVIGMACAVGALLSILALSTGLVASFGVGRPDRAMVMKSGPQAAITQANAGVIADAPGVKKTVTGRPIISGSVSATVSAQKKSDGREVFLQVTGIGTEGLALFPEIKLLNGRMFQPGKFELIAGKNVSKLFTGAEIGKQVDLPQGNWTIVGTFESGNSLEGGLLTDSETLGSALRQPAYRDVAVMLDSPASFENFRRSLATNPALAVEVVRETAYLRRFSFSNFTIIAYVIGAIMGLGAIFGAINTMYATVSRRQIEIATLRAMGFGGLPVMVSILAEAIGLAMIGVAIGALFAWSMFNGNLHSFGSFSFTLMVTPGMAARSAIFAAVLALLGAFFPALRAARQPIATALRAT
jgi:putative ABC transport system permease protein